MALNYLVAHSCQPDLAGRSGLFKHEKHEMQIKIPIGPNPPPQVFMLATPYHMLAKLHWEIHSLRKWLSDEPQNIGHVHAPSYCAFNCAVTAWHLTDWAWNAGDSETRQAIANELKFNLPKDPERALAEFQKTMLSQHRVLRIMQQIATGSKHRGVKRRPDLGIKTEMRWEIEPATVDKLRAGDRIATHHYRLMVSDNGAERPALDAFEEAFATWERLLGNWGFVEHRFIG